MFPSHRQKTMKLAELRRIAADTERILRSQVRNEILSVIKKRYAGKAESAVTDADAKEVYPEGVPTGFVLRSWKIDPHRGRISAKVSFTLAGKASSERVVFDEDIPSDVLIAVLEDIERKAARDVLACADGAVTGSTAPDAHALVEGTDLKVVRDRGPEVDGFSYVDVEEAFENAGVRMDAFDCGYTVLEYDGYRFIAGIRDGVWDILPYIYNENTGLVHA